MVKWAFSVPDIIQCMTKCMAFKGCTNVMYIPNVGDAKVGFCGMKNGTSTVASFRREQMCASVRCLNDKSLIELKWF